MLEHHRQASPQQTQLVLIRHLELTVFIANQTNVLPVNHNRPFAGLFKKVNAAQKGAFTGTG